MCTHASFISCFLPMSLTFHFTFRHEDLPANVRTNHALCVVFFQSDPNVTSAAIGYGHGYLMVWKRDPSNVYAGITATSVDTLVFTPMDE